MKKFFGGIYSFLWVALILVPIFYYAQKMKFPVICPGIITKIITVIVLLFPFIFFLIARITKKEKIFSIIFLALFLFNLLFTCIFTFGFAHNTPFFYPIISYTDSIDDYLVIDDDVLYVNTDDLFNVFPEKVPNEATSRNYEYYCDIPSNTVKIFAKWVLPENEYWTEKSRLISNYNENSFFDYGSLIYTLVVEFNDKEKSICYIYEQG